MKEFACIQSSLFCAFFGDAVPRHLVEVLGRTYCPCLKKSSFEDRNLSTHLGMFYHSSSTKFSIRLVRAKPDLLRAHKYVQIPSSLKVFQVGLQRRGYCALTEFSSPTQVDLAISSLFESNWRHPLPCLIQQIRASGLLEFCFRVLKFELWKMKGTL